MLPVLSVQNLLAWMVQTSVVVFIGLLLPKLFRIRHPRSHLLYCQLLLGICVVLPFLQPWRHQAAANMGGDRLTFSVFGAIPFEKAVLWVVVGGVGLRLSWLLLGMWRIHRYRTRSLPLQPAPESVAFARKLINSDADVLLSFNDVGPVTFGLARPTILLPESFLTLEEDTQTAIICHELIHVRRNDWFSSMIEELAGVILWFHPLVWWLIGKIRLAREQVVDAEVVRRTLVPKPYIEALLTMAGVENHVGVAPTFLRTRHLIDRMRLLLTEDPTSTPRLLSSYALTTSILSVAIFFASAAFPVIGEPKEVGIVPLEIANNVDLDSIVPRHIQQNRPSGQRAYRLDEGVSPPAVVSQVEPEYSDAARQKRIQGSVMLEGIVQTDGSMSVTRVGQSLEQTLDRNAVHALEHWQFEPGRLKGVPVPVQLEVEIHFNVR